jgi:quinol monooxygenase YgiN
MRQVIPLLLIAALPLATAAYAQAPAPAPAPPPAGPIHVATYVEVAPASANTGVGLLKLYRTWTRKHDGNMRTEIAQELGRPNRFVILEIWKDQAAFEAHGKDGATAGVHEKLKVIQGAPADERVHRGFSVGAFEDVKATGAVYVVSHVDVPPPRREECEAALRKLAEESRKSLGNLRFEVDQQTNRPNHFTVVEVWKDRTAYDGRTTAAAQRTFRDKLGPMLGALYDERLYKAVN